MSRTLSNTAIQALMAQETNETFLELLTLTNTDMDTIRLVNDWADHDVSGNTHSGYPFEITLPNDTDEVTPRASVTIDNVDRLLMEAVGEVTTPITATLSVVLASSLTTTEVGPYEFTLRNVRDDALTITGELAFESLMDEPFPGPRATPTNLPAVFGMLPEGSMWPATDRGTEPAEKPARGWTPTAVHGMRRGRR
jgi:hypothetical protein